MNYYYTVQWNTTDDALNLNLENMEQFIFDCLKMNNHIHFRVNGDSLILNQSFWNLLELFCENDLSYSVFSNNLHLDLDVSRMLKNLGCAEFHMSLDGLRKTHDMLHGVGSYDSAIENVKCLRKAGIKTGFMTSVCYKNITQIPWIIDEAVRNRVGKYLFSTFCQSRGIDIHQYKRLLEMVWQKYREYKYSDTSFSIKCNILSLLSYQKYLNNLDCSFEIYPKYDITLSGGVDYDFDDRLIDLL